MPAFGPPGVTITWVAVHQGRFTEQPRDVAPGKVPENVSAPHQGAVLGAHQPEVLEYSDRLVDCRSIINAHQVNATVAEGVSKEILPRKPLRAA